MLEKLPVYWDRCEFIFFPQPQSLHVCREINCEEAGHGCKCLDVAESPAVRQATAGEHYQEKSWGYDGLQPLPLLAQVRSHSQEYGIKRQRRQHTRVCIQKWNTNIVPQFCLFVFFHKVEFTSIMKVSCGGSKQSGGVGILRVSLKARFRDDCT